MARQPRPRRSAGALRLCRRAPALAFALALALPGLAGALAAQPSQPSPAARPAAPGGAGAAAWSASIVDFSPRLDRIFASRRYAGLVVAVDAASGEVAWESRVGQSPRQLSLATVGDRELLLVVCHQAGELWLLDPATGGERVRLAVGPLPNGFTVWGGRFAAVTLPYLHRLVIWDLLERRQVAELEAGRFPATVTSLPERGELYVGSLVGGSFTVVDRESLRVVGEVPSPPRVSQVAGALWLPGSGRLLAPHVLANDHEPFLHFANAVFPVVSVIDAGARRYLEDQRVDLAFVVKPVNGPVAVALAGDGKTLVTVTSRSNDLALVDLDSGFSRGLVEVGRFPLGIAVDAGRQRAYVANAHDHSLSVVDLAERREIGRWSYGEEALPARQARGRDLFFDADSPRLTTSQWISCSSCHPDGRSDGRVWQLPGKPRLRTKDLHGIADTLPMGWLADRDEMQDEELFIRQFHRGKGLSETPPHPHLGPSNAGLSEDLEALSDYVYSLRHAPSPHLVEGRLSPAAARGRELFLSPELGCTACHPPPTYTVSRLPETPRFAGLLSPEPSPVPPVDVPSLLGLYAQPAFLHDGRAETVREIFVRFNQEQTHGRTAGLSEHDLDDLESFLLSLPYPQEAEAAAATSPAAGSPGR